MKALHLGSRSALILAALFAASVYYLSTRASPARHGGYSTPSTNALEDALTKVANEINSATKTAFENAASQLRALDKNTGNVEANSQEARDAIARGLKSAQETVSEKGQDIVREKLGLFVH
jgi:hypothetical protein